MNDGSENNGNSGGDVAAVKRPALRLIQGGPDSSVEAPSPARPGLSRSPLVSFMQAWADAIDREVNLILEK